MATTLLPTPDSGSEVKRKQWQVPKWKDLGEERAAIHHVERKEVHEWVRQQWADGREYQESMPGYTQLEEAIRIISGKPTEKLALKQKDERYSKLQTNRLKRNVREMVNALSEVRYPPGFKSDSQDNQDQAMQFNRLGAAWYDDNMIDLKIKKGVQWAAISPCGWLEPVYREMPGEAGRRDIDIEAHSFFDVTMTGVPESGDHQEAYTVTIHKNVPVYMAHGEWPEFQHVLIPDSETPRGWKEKVQAVYDWFFMDVPDKTTARNPTVKMHFTYVKDLSINDSGQTMKMGYIRMQDGSLLPSPWSYDVPSYRSQVQTGLDASGQPTFRYVTMEEARIFPGRRLIVSTERWTIYDGPMFDWHGMVPLIKIAGDDWPFAEYSLVHDVAPIHDAVSEIERVSHQTVRNRFNPTMLFNWRAIDRTKAKALRTDVQGQRVGFNGNEASTARGAVDTLTGPEFNKVDDWITILVKDLRNEMDYQMGVTAAAALAKIKAGGSQDQLEKLMDEAGPIVKGIARQMERSFRDMANIFKYLVMQYYTSPKIIQITGVAGATPENWDFDPGNLIPSHLPHEVKSQPSKYSKMHRAHWLARNIRFRIAPNTLHQIVQTTQKLMYLQLWRQGFPIDPWTMAEVMGIPDFGKVPEGTRSMWERWMAWQKMQLQFKIASMAQAKQIADELGLGDIMGGGDGGGGGGGGGGKQGAKGGGPGGGTPGTGPKGGARGSGGRAPSGQSAPQMVQKDGGTRTTISESE